MLGGSMNELEVGEPGPFPLVNEGGGDNGGVREANDMRGERSP